LKTEEEWAEQAKRIFRAEMKRRGFTYDDLSAKLAENGVQESSANIRNKVARGKFSAVFMLQSMDAMGCKSIILSGD